MDRRSVLVCFIVLGSYSVHLLPPVVIFRFKSTVNDSVVIRGYVSHISRDF